MHVCPVLIYGPVAGESQSLDIEVIRQTFSDSLPKSPILTQKLLSLPMGMDEPYWVTDKKFDLDSHIEEISLPTPGNWKQLTTCLARIHARGLNMKKPLWQATFITGLDDIVGIPTGSVALVLKIHHAAIDGVSLARLIATLHDKTPSSEKDADSVQLGGPDQYEMWNRAGRKSWTRQLKLASTVSKLIPAVTKLKDVKKSEEFTSTTKHSKTRFNTEVSNRRVIGSLHIPMADLKAIKRGVRRVTPNDIAVSIVGGALRRYLKAYGELPKSSLVCGAPINLRSGDDGADGNKIATMQIGLATDIKNPVDRVRAVHQYALLGKARINTLGTGTVMDISDSVAPGVLAEGLRALSFASTRVSEIPVPFHVMISNVPGPLRPISLHDAPLHALIGLGPIRHSMGLFHVVSNSSEYYSISFTSCRSIMPDPEFYEKCLRKSFKKLLAAAQELGSTHE